MLLSTGKQLLWLTYLISGALDKQPKFKVKMGDVSQLFQKRCKRNKQGRDKIN